MAPTMNFSKLQFLALALILSISVYGQMSTDNRLCGGYQREMNGFLDFEFDENTAPPGTAMGKKFCLWTISPTVPTEQFRYNMTIRNINLDCTKDSIAINYFDESAADVMLHESWQDPIPTTNPLCLDSHEVWERRHVNGTVMVVILYVEEVVYGKGFYLEWEQGYDSRITPGRPRNTYHSFGKPSVAPNPYFAAGFRNNEISTFGFVKANYTDGYVMDLHFFEVRSCEGQNDWMECFQNTFTVFKIEETGILAQEARYTVNVTDTPVLTSSNGFFIIVKIEDNRNSTGGGRFSMYYDTVRG